MPSAQTNGGAELQNDKPDITVSVRQTFGMDCDMQVPAFSHASDYVPDLDEAYRFDHDTTLAILAGFAHNRRAGRYIPGRRASARRRWRSGSPSRRP